MTIEEVLNKYLNKSVKVSFEQFGTGATNATYKVIVRDNGNDTHFVLQHMSPFFNSASMEDIDAVTKHLESKNFTTQLVVRTLDGKLLVEDGDSWWRVLTYIPGIIFDSISSTEQAYEAGRLVGEFYTALLDFDYQFKHKLLHYRDTDFYMQELRTIPPNDLSENILNFYEKLPQNNNLPNRIIHGDLKISNVIFNDSTGEAIALIDWDTLMRGPIALDLGDALRSWCMPGGEDVDIVTFDKEAYDEALKGYFSTVAFLTQEEKDSIPWGVKLITLELAARFTIDAHNQNYFKLDNSKYKNLFDQNKKRAENQLKFFEEYQKLF